MKVYIVFRDRSSVQQDAAVIRVFATKEAAEAHKDWLNSTESRFYGYNCYRIIEEDVCS